MAAVPGGDLVPPPNQGAPKRVDFRWAGLVLVSADPIDELGGEVRIGMGVDLADDLFGMPRGFDGLEHRQIRRARLHPWHHPTPLISEEPSNRTRSTIRRRP